MEMFEERFLSVIKGHYADYQGRVGRPEFWYYVLFNFAIAMALSVVASILGSVLKIGIFGFLPMLYFLATIVPSVCIGIRRMHDIGKPGTWLLIGLIPVLGLAVIYFLVQDSEADRNQYGPNPKRGAVA